MGIGVAVNATVVEAGVLGGTLTRVDVLDVIVVLLICSVTLSKMLPQVLAVGVMKFVAVVVGD